MTFFLANCQFSISVGRDAHAHGVQLVARLGGFRRLRVSLDQRAQFANACIALALRQQRQSLVVLRRRPPWCSR